MTAKVLMSFRCKKHDNALEFDGQFNELFYDQITGVIAMTGGWRHLFHCPIASDLWENGMCDPRNDWNVDVINA